MATPRNPWDQLSPMSRALVDVPTTPAPEEVIRQFVWDEPVRAWRQLHDPGLGSFADAGGSWGPGDVVVTISRAMQSWSMADQEGLLLISHRGDGGPAEIPLGRASGPKWIMDGENVFVEPEAEERELMWERAGQAYDERLRQASLPPVRPRRVRA